MKQLREIPAGANRTEIRQILDGNRARLEENRAEVATAAKAARLANAVKGALDLAPIEYEPEDDPKWAAWKENFNRQLEKQMEIERNFNRSDQPRLKFTWRTLAIYAIVIGVLLTLLVVAQQTIRVNQVCQAGGYHHGVYDPSHGIRFCVQEIAFPYPEDVSHGGLEPPYPEIGPQW